MLRSIKSEQRQARNIHVNFTGQSTPAITVGAGSVTITRNGTGDHTLTFAKPFVTAPVVVATAGTASRLVRVGTLSTTAVQILTTDLSAVAADSIVHLQINGFDATIV